MMPTTGGILCLVAGGIDIVLGIATVAIGEAAGLSAGFWELGAMGMPLIILGMVAIIGGIFALQRRVWDMALDSGLSVPSSGPSAAWVY
ncbi:hypothetical protein ACFLW3_00355 [Chloroflexota bacterium]